MFKPYTILKTLLVLFSLSWTTKTYAQGDLKAAWSAFFENKRDNAREHFTKASLQKESSSEAFLGLSLLGQLDNNGAASFDYFKKFYTGANDAQPYLYALWTTESINTDFGKKSPEKLAFLRELTQKNYDGMLTAMAYNMIGRHFLKSKKAALADKEFVNIGSIDAWAITGEFQNISTSGFDKTYATLTNAHDTASFKNKNGVNIAWHTVPYLRHDKWFDLTYYGDAYNGIVFAQNFIRSEKEQEVQLRIGVSGSLKVWVNDRLVLSEPDERNNDIDSYVQTIKLHQGYNRVLLQVGESYAESSNFLLRITDDKGRVIPGLSATAKYQPYVKEDKFESVKIENFAETFFLKKLNVNADDVLSRILLAQTYLNTDKTFEARKMLEPLIIKHPNSTFLNGMLLTLFNKTNNRTGQETIKETIKMADPESNIGLKLRYNELFEQKEYDKAGEIIKRIEELYPYEGEMIYASRIDIADNTDKPNEVIRLSEEGYAKYTDNRLFMKNKYLIESNIRKNASKGIDVLKKFVDNNDNYTSAKDLAEAYFEAGKGALGLKVYQDELTFDPVATGIYSALGDQYYSQQQYNKAAESYMGSINLSPTTGEYYNSLAKVYEATSQKDKAIQFYQKSIQMDPTEYESIKALRKLEGKKDVFSYFTEPNIAAIIKAAPKPADFPDFNYAILNQEVQKVVYQNGGSEDRRYLTVKIFNQKGLDTWKEYSVPTSPDYNLLIEAAEVIKANGSKIPAEKNESDIVFTNLEVGDVVNIRYKTGKYSKGELAPHFWDNFYFAQGCPAITLKYSLLIDKKKPFYHQFSLANIDPEKKTADEFDLYTWKKENVKGIAYEEKLPAFADISNCLSLTSIPDWNFVSNWYNDLASAKARPNYEVKSVVAELFKSANNLTDLQKIEAIYYYITGNISYSSVPFRQSGIVPQNPSTVINTRIGDCKDVATLFVAMCREAGVKAQLVLVKTRPYGLKSLTVPNVEFNHCIAKVNIDSKDFYIELTSKYLPFRAIYSPQLNSTILDIGESKSDTKIKYLDPTTRLQNNVSRASTVIFRGKDLVIDESIEMTAGMAGMSRQFYIDLSPNDRVKKTTEAMSRTYADAEIKSLSFTNLELPASDTLKIKTNYEIRNLVKEIAGLQIFSLPWSDKFTAGALQISLPRVNGIDLSQLFSMDVETESFTVQLPAGKTLIELPMNVTLSNEAMDYSIASVMKNNQLILTRNIKVKKTFIPAEKAAEFNDFFKKIVEADNKELALK